MSNSLHLHRLQHTGLPCSSLSPGFCWNSYPWSWWCHPMISSFVAPFSCPQFSPASQSFPVSQFFASFGQSIRASASDLPINTQDWCPLGLVVWSPFNPRDSQESSPTPQFKRINSLVLGLPYGPALTSVHDYWKNHSFDYMDKVVSLFFNMLYRFVIALLPRSKLSFNVKATVTICSDFGTQENKIRHCFHCFPNYLPWSDGTGCHYLSILKAEF